MSLPTKSNQSLDCRRIVAYLQIVLWIPVTIKNDTRICGCLWVEVKKVNFWLISSKDPIYLRKMTYQGYPLPSSFSGQQHDEG